jgi:hypothetical protein
MPDASATRGVRFGLAGKIFVASALLVAVVLGVTFGVTSFQANRTADASIERALAASRTAVEDFLAARTRTLGRASTVATDVPQYRETFESPLIDVPHTASGLWWPEAESITLV